MDSVTVRRDIEPMRQMLAMLRGLFVLLMFAAPAPAMADGPYVDTAALDELFAQLRVATSAAEADELSQQIWGYWMNPSDATLADRMATAGAFLSVGDLQSTLGVLDTIVQDYPDYSEGWNQRATVHYMMSDFASSLADIEQVLAYEPRHFGALSGRVLIYLKQGKRADALRDMIAAIAIHPYLNERKLFPELGPDVTHV
jgi:tetratricopeptide (TPR) repeat protein